MIKCSNDEAELRFATASRDGSVKAWMWNCGGEIEELQRHQEHAKFVNSLAYIPADGEGGYPEGTFEIQ